MGVSSENTEAVVADLSGLERHVDALKARFAACSPRWTAEQLQTGCFELCQNAKHWTKTIIAPYACNLDRTLTRRHVALLDRLVELIAMVINKGFLDGGFQSAFAMLTFALDKTHSCTKRLQYFRPRPDVLLTRPLMASPGYRNLGASLLHVLSKLRRGAKFRRHALQSWPRSVLDLLVGLVVSSPTPADAFRMGAFLDEVVDIQSYNQHVALFLAMAQKAWDGWLRARYDCSSSRLACLSQRAKAEIDVQQKCLGKLLSRVTARCVPRDSLDLLADLRGHPGHVDTSPRKLTGLFRRHRRWHIRRTIKLLEAKQPLLPMDVMGNILGFLYNM